MKTKNVRIAIVGAGRVSEHYKAMFDLPTVSGFEIVGVCDIDHVRANLLASHFGCESFYSISNLYSTGYSWNVPTNPITITKIFPR